MKATIDGLTRLSKTYTGNIRNAGDLFAFAETTVGIVRQVAAVVVDQFERTELVEDVIESRLAEVGGADGSLSWKVFFEFRVQNAGPVRAVVWLFRHAGSLATVTGSRFSLGIRLSLIHISEPTRPY